MHGGVYGLFFEAREAAIERQQGFFEERRCAVIKHGGGECEDCGSGKDDAFQERVSVFFGGLEERLLMRWVAMQGPTKAIENG